MTFIAIKPKKIEHISYSYLNYAICPYAAWLRYDGGVRVKPTPWIVLGNAVHSALEETGKEPEFNIEQALSLFKDKFRQEIEGEEVFVSYPTMRKLEVEGMEMLDMYYGQIQSGAIPAKPSLVEKEFILPVTKKLDIVGKIDRIDIIDGEYEVSDYKTGKAKPDKWFLSHDLQLTAYAWAVLILFGKLPSKMYYWHLRSGDRMETVRTLQDVEDLKNRIADVWKMRQAGIKSRVYSKDVCEPCDYSGWDKRFFPSSNICEDRELEARIEEGLKSLGA